MADDLPLHRGACLCANYELRVTGRCLVDDLGLSADTSFRDALGQEIVGALMAKRSQVPIGAKTVGPLAGGKTLYHLGIGDDYRGATWFDPVERVVWLCAAGFHRSGNDQDFFQQVRPLIASRAIYPTVSDHRRALVERELRLAELGPIDASRLVAEARCSPEQLVSGSLAQLVPVRIKVKPGQDLDEIYVAFTASVLARAPKRLNLLIRCFDEQGELYPDFVDSIPGEAVLEADIVMLIVRAPG